MQNPDDSPELSHDATPHPYQAKGIDSSFAWDNALQQRLGANSSNLHSESSTHEETFHNCCRSASLPRRREPGREAASFLQTQWPFRCQYFNSQVMSSAKAVSCILDDGEFLPSGSWSPQFIPGLLFSPDGFTRGDCPQLWSTESSSQDGCNVSFIPQTRRYFQDRSTKCSIELELALWLIILDEAKVPPTAVELLHDNNGGFWQHTSYCSDNPRALCQASPHGHEACAYHVCIKLGNCNSENFIYARHDFHTQHSTILVMGTETSVEQGRMENQFANICPANLFTVIVALVGVWADELEKFRWRLDYDIQRAEGETGYGALYETNPRPLPVEKMALRESIAKTQHGLRIALRPSEQLNQIYAFLVKGLARFEDLNDSAAESSKDVSNVTVYESGWCKQQRTTLGRIRLNHQLADAMMQRKSQQEAQTGQIRNLMYRIDTQWNIIATLVAQHTNQLNVGMAKDTRSDSIQMRKISAITMVFLSATFMATFFSMIFFHASGNGSLHADSTIWVYFVCTFLISSTMVACFRYDQLWESPVRLAQNLFRSRPKQEGDKEKADGFRSGVKRPWKEREKVIVQVHNTGCKQSYRRR